MNKIKQILAILSFAPSLCLAQTTSENYVKAETMLNASGSSSIKSVQYYNGLGYPTVSVAMTGGNGETSYSLTTYDGVGREEYKYLPVSTDKSLDYKSPTDIISNAKNFYEDSYPYSRNHYDALDRVTAMDIPGAVWVNNNKKNKTEFLVNTDADCVLHYEAPNDSKYQLVKPENTSYQYYPSGSLTKVVSYDADNKSVTVFSDLQGKKILERTAAGDTYYVYNILGQLRFVLSPLYQKNGQKAISAYEYRYDNRGRVVKKILPGCKYIQYWYDNADRLAYMQDAEMRKQSVYRFYLYDKLGRQVIQGVCSQCKRGGSIYTAEFNASAAGFFNTNYVIPNEFVSNLRDSVIETVNYYDNHKFMSNKYFSGMSLTGICSQMGMLTGSVSRAGNGEYLSQAMAYDLKGNVIKSVSREIGGRISTHTNTYTFTNNLQSSIFDIDVKYGEKCSIIESVDYNKYIDKKEQSVLTISHGFNVASSTMTYQYDSLGRIKDVNRPSSDVNYTYEMHGWLNSINSKSFNEKLYYANCLDSTYNCYNGNIGTMTWSNSNYSQLRGYKFKYDAANRLTDAFYGERTDLTNKENRYNENVEYDENGNITNLERRGKKQDGEYGKIDNLNLAYDGNHLISVEEDAKELLYSGSFDYNGTNGSQYKYNDNGSLTADKSRGIAHISYDYNNNPETIYFTNGNTTEYVYSAAGQKLRVIYKTAKPNVVTRTLDDAEYQKLTSAQILYADSIDYLLGGSLVMRNGRIDKYLFDGGYCQASAVQCCIARPMLPFGSLDDDVDISDDEWAAYQKNFETWKELMEKENSKDEFTFCYYTKDHLGNIREVVDVNDSVKQVTNYYPFGATYCDATGTLNTDMQPYKYNGKELDKMHGLNTYDYGARQHDPILCRWDRMDRFCEKYYSCSPYSFCMNNPIKSIDVNGDSCLVLLAPYGARSAGHMAIAIQDENGMWGLYSKNGTEENGGFSGPEGKEGTEKHNDRGEKKTNTYLDIFSDKSINPPANKSNPNAPENAPEYTQGYMIPSTPKQDKQLRNGALETINKDYNLLNSNCAQTVQNALLRAGFNGGSGISPKFQVYPSIIATNKGKFVFFYNTKTEKYYKYGKK